MDIMAFGSALLVSCISEYTISSTWLDRQCVTDNLLIDLMILPRPKLLAILEICHPQDMLVQTDWLESFMFGDTVSCRLIDFALPLVDLIDLLAASALRDCCHQYALTARTPVRMWTDTNTNNYVHVDTPMHPYLGIMQLPIV